MEHQYEEWLRRALLDVNLQLGKLAITKDDISDAIPVDIYIQLVENGDLNRRTLITNIPIGVFELLYRKNRSLRSAVREIHDRYFSQSVQDVAESSVVVSADLIKDHVLMKAKRSC